MDTFESTRTVLSRIQSLDPENATKITGYILLQDQGEKEMIRLAFSPESLLLSYVNQAKACLGLPSNNCSTPSTPSSPSPFSNNNNNNNNNPLSNSNRCNPFSQASPRIVIPNTRFHLNNPSSPSSPWSARSSRSASYAAVVNGSANTPSGSSSSSLSFPFFGNNTSDLSDEFANIHVQDQLPFLDEPSDPIVSPSRRSDSVGFPFENFEDNSVANHHQQLHRRSFSVNDVFLGGGEDGGVGGNCGFGWRPCLYFARGFCKNGNTCKFLHSGGGFGVGDSSPDGGAGGPLVGSPGKIDGFDELLKLKALQQQRLAQQLMASGAPPSLSYSKCATFLNENQRSAAAALAMGDEFLKLGRCRPDRSDFFALGFGGNANSASRQIYLTFPADSTFKEEDVSKYFSIYGPVQDVRIPYQQKRMFGFVTFLYAETVKLILAKGNPHFVCDSRVLVKPYKEKGKVPDKKQPQHLERGDFSGCLSPTGHESRDLFDIPFGSRMFYNAQEIMLRRKLEQEAELKQAIELQGRRLMNMQLMDLKNYHPNQFNSSMLPGVQMASPTQSQSHINNTHPNINPLSAGNGINSDIHEDTNGYQEAIISPTAAGNEQVPGSPDNGNGIKEDSSNVDESDIFESLENALPDNLFASPTKSAADMMNSAFTSTSADDIPITSANYISMLPTASHKSCYFQMSRFSSGQEAAEI